MSDGELKVLGHQFYIEWDHGGLYLHHECGAVRDGVGLVTLGDFVEAAAKHKCPPEQPPDKPVTSDWETGEVRKRIE